MTNKRRKVPGDRYGSVLDWWLVAPLFIILLTIAASIPLIIWQNFPLIVSVAVVPVLIITFLLLVDRIFFTSYILGDDGLLISGQIRRYFIPYRSIIRVKNGNLLDLLSFGSRKRFALSGSNVVLFLEEMEWKRVSLSPKDKQRFITALHDHLDHNRVVRVARPKSKKKARTKK